MHKKFPYNFLEIAKSDLRTYKCLFENNFIHNPYFSFNNVKPFCHSQLDLETLKKRFPQFDKSYP